MDPSRMRGGGEAGTNIHGGSNTEELLTMLKNL